MTRTIKLRTKRQQIGYILGLLCFCVQTSLAAERWKIVVLPDTNYNTPNELPTLTDLHSTISQGLTIALTNADFDVLNLHYLGLPNCIIEDCSTLTDQTIQQAAIRSGKTVNLALLYQLNVFKQRQAASQRWYFGLSGRLLDLQSATQQDAFSVDNWVNNPAKSCVGDCYSKWLNQNLALLAQDLGAVLSEKLEALPRRFHYQLTLNSFSNSELQQINQYLKHIKGYVADVLLTDSTNTSIDSGPDGNRTYQYISELTASELSSHLDKLNQQYSLFIKVEYNNAQRQFNLIRGDQIDPWETLSQFITGLIDNSEQQDSELSPPEDTPPLPVAEPQKTETDEEKATRKDNQMWQQARNVNTLGSYQQYLTIWPKGLHLIQANAAINLIQDDDNSWLQASKIKTREAYQQYLAFKPEGKYRAQAKQQLAKLRELQQQKQKREQNKALADDYYYQQQNYPEALYYYQQASKLGDVSSKFLLGKMYEEGRGTDKNLRQAAIWYTQAAEQGDKKAQATLGYMYSKGDGVTQDYYQAVNWYKKAAEQGHINAQYNLAYLYSLGQGVVKNYQQAAYWYQQSATQGDQDAQNSLGKLYERGLGVNKDLPKAKKLYQQAAVQGHQMARINLRMLNNLNSR